jgi:cell division protein ZipA
VVANGHFDGQTLLESIVELGLVFGEMSIFHRLDEDGHTAFSLANSVEPGTFDLAKMDNLQIAGVVLFMRVHEVHDPIEVYDNMMDVAQKLCDEFGGKLQDESRSAMTSQTIEHCRQGIRDFQFKYSA